MLKSIATLPFLALVACTSPSPPGSDPATWAPDDPQGQTKLEADMVSLGQPGPEHERLAAMAGTWDLEQRMFMPGSDTPQVVRGEVVSEMVLGGRFLRIHTEVAGFSESIGFLGFDRRHGEFTTVGFDTLGTYWVTGAGPYDPERDALVLYGEDEDPIAGLTQRYEFVISQPSADELIVAVVFLPGSFGITEPWKAVELFHTRR